MISRRFLRFFLCKPFYFKTDRFLK